MQTLTRTSLLALLAAAPMASVAQPPELMQPQAAQASETQSSWSADRATRLLAYVEQVGADGLNPASYSPDRLRAAMGDEAARSRVADEIFLKLAAISAAAACAVPTGSAGTWPPAARTKASGSACCSGPRAAIRPRCSTACCPSTRNMPF
jgi:murein L,D-transpeptidase YcbB/YkuD